VDKDRQRQYDRDWQNRRIAQAKAEGKHPVAWLLPQDDLAIVDQIKEAHAYKSRADAVSMMLTTIRNSAKLRKEFGL